MDKEATDRFKGYNLVCSSGMIIGEAEIVDCILVDDVFKKELLKENNEVYKYSEGYGFKLENIIKYKEKAPCKGMLGLWNYEQSNI